MQYWIVKSGTKEVISGPFETQDEANKEMARFPVGGDAKSVTQGYYLGNGLLEAVNGEWMSREDFDKKAEEIRKNVDGLRYDIGGNTKYLQGQPYGKNKTKRRKIYAIAAGYSYRTDGVTSDGTPMVEMPEVFCAFSFEGELTYNDMSYLDDAWSAAFEKAKADAGIPVNPSRTVTFTNFESIYDLEKAKEELQYALQDLRDAKAAGEDKEVIKELQDEVKRCREVLNSLSESASSQEEANKLLNVWFNDRSPSAWGSKSFIVSKLAKSMGVSLKVAAELHKNWANLNEAASFDFSTTNDADILKVSAALEKAGIPFEVEEKGESFVVKVLDSRDQLVASELIGDTMKESSGFSEGEEVKVVGNVSGEGKVGIIRDVAPSGHFYVVKFSDGTSSSYHESNLVAYEGDDEDEEDLDESEDYSNVVSQHEHRNKSATVFKKDDEFEVVFYRDGGKLARDFYDSKEEAQSEAKAWVAGGINESTQFPLKEAATWKVVDVKTGEELGKIEKFYKDVGTSKKPEWKVWYRDVADPSKKADTRGALAAHMAYDPSLPNKTKKHKVVAESAQLSPFERAGLNPVYSEDGKKATVKIFSECDMEKFNKVVEAYLNTYIESIEYKIEESDDNCLYVIEVRLVQSPETKGDPETMMKELKTESVLIENEVTDQVLDSIAAFLKSNPNLVVSGSHNSTKIYSKDGVEFGYSYSSQTRPPIVTVSLLDDKLSLLGLLTEPPKFVMRANFNGLHSVSSLKSAILNKAKSSLIQQLKNEREKSTEQIDQLLKIMQ